MTTKTEYRTLDTTDKSEILVGDRVTISHDGYEEMGEVTGVAYTYRGFGLLVADFLIRLGHTTIHKIERPITNPEAADQRTAEFAAVVKKVRDEVIKAQLDPDLGDWADDLLDILATAPADALREHDVALIEELADEWHADNTGTSPRAYNWLREKARQRREEQS
ncbi:MAG: hypothetical protein ACTH4Y_11435 [Microbacterium gubbeenense]|uniref:hypothetical protein n=1 Tax=Microbacterium gubbeenense TaxID=159896 RepID=UPI003F9E9FA3